MDIQCEWGTAKEYYGKDIGGDGDSDNAVLAMGNESLKLNKKRGQNIPKSKDQYSSSDSLDDAIIRNKIEEANQLIDRVKKTLDKMKFCRKKAKPAADVKKNVHVTSSTDIEETIKNLKKETEQLITGDIETALDQDLKNPKIHHGYRGDREKTPENQKAPVAKPKREKMKDEETSSSCGTPNRTVVMKDKKERQTSSSSDESNEKPAPKVVMPHKPGIARDMEKLTECCRVGTLDMNRPVTRRNETEEELPEERILDKFRNCPENGQLEVNSSLEELQAKLQTISESTESTTSTPRNTNYEDQGIKKPTNIVARACNTESLETESKETQVELKTKSIGLMCCCTSGNKSIQTSPNPKKALTICPRDVESLTPPPKQLQQIKVQAHEIPPIQIQCDRWKAENLPVVEVMPQQQKNVCNKCKKDLREEHLQGVCIPSRLDKLKKLTVKVLPPISIIQKMAVMQVLNFFITPQGETQNLLKETRNIGFVAVTSGMESEKYIGTASRSTISTTYSGRIDPKRNSMFFLKLRDDVVKTLDLTEELAKDKEAAQKLDDEDQRKLQVYKSYQLYDNRNKHDPGGLDQEDVYKVSEIDANFYKTFINPSGKVSEKDMPFRPKASSMFGFESKEVQCNEESLIAAEAKKSLLTQKQDEDIVSMTPLILDKPTSKSSSKFRKRASFMDRKKSQEKTSVPYVDKTIRPSTSSDKSKRSLLEKLTSQSIAEPTSSAMKEPTSPNMGKRTTLTARKSTGFSMDKRTTLTIKEPIIQSMDKPTSPLMDTRAALTTKEPIILSMDKPTSPLMDTRATLTTKEPIILSMDKPASAPMDKRTSALANKYQDSEVTILRLKSLDEISPPRPEVPLVLSRPPDVLQDTSKKDDTPSEITVTISYSQSSEGSINSEQNTRVNEQTQKNEITSAELREKFRRLESDSNIDAKSEKSNLKNSQKSTSKSLGIENMEVIQKLQEKFKSVDVNSSDPGLIMHKEQDVDGTVHTFIQGLTKIYTSDQETTSEDTELVKTTDVNYHMIDMELDAEIKPYSKHLMLAKNGRYKDEENLFAQNPIPELRSQRWRSCSPNRAIENNDEEVQNSKLRVYPKYTLNKYSPDTTNSDTVTTNSVSEGEVQCKHSISNGEIHICKNAIPIMPRTRNILPRSNLTSPSMSSTRNMQNQRYILPRSNLTNSSMNTNHYASNQGNILTHNRFTRFSNRSSISNPKKFDLLDPSLTIEKRRNYFNNWVTYYVKNQEINDSSTSSCSQNK